MLSQRGMDLTAILVYAALSGTPVVNVPEPEPLNRGYAVQSWSYIDLGLGDFKVLSESEIDIGKYDFEVSGGD